MTDDFKRLRKYTTSLPRRFYIAVLRAALYLEGMVEEEAPVVTGNLVNHISSYVEDRGENSYGVVVLGSKYAGFVIGGTGIYGPHKSPIVPTRKQALAFVYKGMKVVVRSVRGQKANPFHKRALRKALPKLNQIIKRTIG